MPESKPRPGLSALMQTKKPKLSKEETVLSYQFWKPVTRTAEDNEEKTVQDIRIDQLIFYRFLYSEGFRRLRYGDHYIFVQITNDRIVKRVEVEDMINTIQDYIDAVPLEITTHGVTYSRDMVESKYLDKIHSLFNEIKLKTLRPKIPMAFNQDTLTTCYIYFNNGYLQIDKDKRQLRDYKTLDGYIWDSQIIKRNYHPAPVIPEKDFVRRFCLNICGGDKARLHSFMNNLGYYMHKFTDYKTKALLLTDGKISDDGDANGRTGKGLTALLVGGTMSNNPKDETIKSFVQINAKDFDVRNKHKYSAADVDTKLIVLNDLKKNFNLDDLYNDITEGIIVDRKGKDPFRIMAKLILISNKPVRMAGDSSKDRVVEFEFSEHYSAKFSPEEDFGHYMFRDWNDEDYCRYLDFMAECAHIFFKNSSKLIQPESINLNSRKLLDATSREFIDFVEQDWNPIPGEKYNKTIIYQKFITVFPDYAKGWFSQARFTSWIKEYMRYRDQWEPYNPKTNEDRDSDGTRYYIFIKKK